MKTPKDYRKMTAAQLAKETKVFDREVCAA